MNLSDQEKRWFSKILLVLGGLAIIALLSFGVNKLVQNRQRHTQQERTELIKKYQSKIDSAKAVNSVLTIQIDSLKTYISKAEVKKSIVYIETIKKDKEIKDATAEEHAKAIDTLTGQTATWKITSDSISKQTLINYTFTKPGIVKLRLTVNDLYKYKVLNSINESIIEKQKAEISLQDAVIVNDKIIIDAGKNALEVSTVTNDKLTKQLNRAQNRAGKWPVWAGAGFIGGVALCLFAR